MKSNKLLACASFLILTISLIGGYFFYRRPFIKQITNSPSIEKKAFINTEWGMSVKEVQQVNRIELERIQNYERYYSPKKALRDLKKLEAYKETGIKFLGREATVTYIFFNNRLFQYHVFIQDSDKSALEEDLTRYLTKEFGFLFIRNDEGLGLRRIWQKKDRIINDWFYQDDLCLIKKYSAGFAVLYLPIENEIR